MKKLALTIAIVLGMSFGAFAQEGGLFGMGPDRNNEDKSADRGSLGLGLPGHGESTDQDAPLAGGALLLIGFGAAYALKKNNEK